MCTIHVLKQVTENCLQWYENEAWFGDFDTRLCRKYEDYRVIMVQNFFWHEIKKNTNVGIGHIC